VLERRGSTLLILLPGCVGRGNLPIASPAGRSNRSVDDFMRVLLSTPGGVAIPASCDVALEELARGPPE